MIRSRFGISVYILIVVDYVRDNLGSITAVTDSAGHVLQRLSYDPWGTLRDPVTLVPFAPGDEPDLLLGRGYTGHEHLPWFGLVNMNARLYDPAMGRFLNPDPLVQDPTSTQSFNRYSYCLNNPLRYSDPTGRDIVIYKDGVLNVFKNRFIDFWLYVVPGEATCTVYRNNGTSTEFGGNYEMHEYFRPPNGDLAVYFGDIELYNRAVQARGGAPIGGSTAGNRVTGKADNSPLSSKAISVTLSAANSPFTVIDEMWNYAARDKLGMSATQEVTAADYEKAFDKNMAKFSKGVRILNKSLSYVDAALSIHDAYQDWEEGKSTRALARLGGAAVVYGSAFIPVVGPFISLGLGIANAIWGDELIYDNIDN